MQVMHNSAAQLTLGELRKNDTALGKQLKKVSSGMKVNGASDGAAEYAISEKMRVRLRSLAQDIVTMRRRAETSYTRPRAVFRKSSATCAT